MSINIPSSGSKSIESLIEEAKRGSAAALGDVVESCRSYLLLVANRDLSRKLKPKVGPSDVVQETFLEAQRDFAQFQGGTKGALLAWLRRILRNNLSNQSRRFREASKRRVSLEVPLAGADGMADSLTDRSLSPISMAILHEQGHALEHAMNRLPSHYRRQLIWRHWDDKSFEEIAAISGRSADAARMLWWRAFERLTKELRSQPGYGQQNADSSINGCAGPERR